MSSEIQTASTSHLSSRKQFTKNPKLTIVLDSQKVSENLQLGDLYFGDEGAFQVAEFLKQNKKCTTIDIRGNDLSATGFQIICNAVGNSNQVTKISASWNNIGSDPSGLLALYELIKDNKKISHIDLSNNQIGSRFALTLSRIIKESKHLKHLDLRWNQLDDKAATDILQALKDNKLYKPYVDVSGNKISDDLFMEIDSVVRSINGFIPSKNDEEGKSVKMYIAPNPDIMNKKVLTHTQTGGQGFAFNAYKASMDDYSVQLNNRKMMRKEEESRENYFKMREVILNLESVVEEQRRRILEDGEEIKRILFESDNEKKQKHDLKLQFNELLDTVKNRDEQIDELCLRVELMTNEIAGLHNQIALLDDENHKMMQQFNSKLREVEDKYLRQVKELEFDKKGLRMQIENMKNEYDEMTREFQIKHEEKYRLYEQELHTLSALNANLSVDLTKQAANIQSLNARRLEELRGTVQRCKEEESQTVNATRKTLEQELVLLKETNKQLHLKYLNSLDEVENQRKENTDLKQRIDDEANQYRSQIDGLLLEVKELTATLFEQKNELAAKDSHIFSLEDELDILNIEKKRIQDLNAEKLERVKRDFDFERRRHDDEERRMRAKVFDHEQNLREAENEISRLKQEYERVADLVKGNVSKIIVDTFLENARPDI